MPAVFDFGQAPAALVDSIRKHPAAIEVHVPSWFDSMAIDYRLAYVDPSRLREYAFARWAGPPSRLLEQRLGRLLAMSPAGQGRADCMLRVDISEFSQVFSSPTESKGVLQGRAQWLDRSRRPLAMLDLNIEIPAASPDARGGIGALQAAVSQLAIDLQGWERRLAKTAPAAACLP